MRIYFEMRLAQVYFLVFRIMKSILNLNHFCFILILLIKIRLTSNASQMT